MAARTQLVFVIIVPVCWGDLACMNWLLVPEACPHGRKALIGFAIRWFGLLGRLVSRKRLCGMSDGHTQHYEIWKYCQSTSKMHA